jgi:hypothetical protein
MSGHVHVYEHVHVISSKGRQQVSFASLPWGVSAFMAFSDDTLRDMLGTEPRTLSEMLRISGVGNESSNSAASSSWALSRKLPLRSTVYEPVRTSCYSFLGGTRLHRGVSREHPTVSSRDR